MKYDWLYLSGWVNMLLPYILPFWIILTFVYGLLINTLVLKLFKIPKETYSLFKVSICVSAISFCTFLIECIFTHVFTTLMHYNDPKYGFVDVRDGFGLSIYENTVFFIFTLISVCFCIYITYKLNCRFTTQLLANYNGNKKPTIIFISLLTSPFVFFVPLKDLLYMMIPIQW